MVSLALKYRIRSYLDGDALSSSDQGILTSVFVICALAGVLNPVFWLPALLLLYPLRTKLHSLEIQQISPRHFFLPQVGFIALMMAIVAPLPPDDLLRSVVSSTFDFDYRRLYLNTTVPRLDLWWGFDRLLGLLSFYVGKDLTVRIVQITAAVVFLVSFTMALSAELHQRSDKWLWIGLAVCILFASPVAGRIVSGRSEIFFASYVLFAFTLRPFWWVLLGLILAPFYWLSPVYALSGLLLSVNWRQKIISTLIVALGSVVIWMMLSNGAWIELFPLMKHWMANRLGKVGENAPLLASIRSPVIVVLLIIGYAAALRSKLTKTVWPILLVLGWFLLPNMVRYIGVILPLALLLAARCAADSPVVIGPRNRFWFLIVGICLIVYGSAVQRNDGKSKEDLPSFHLPSGSKVFTAFDSSSYSMPFNNPSSQFFASYELGANSKEVQRLQNSLYQDHKVDCAGIYSIGATHVVERYLKVIPSCLKLEAVQNEWRLWSVIQSVQPLTSKSSVSGEPISSVEGKNEIH